MPEPTVVADDTDALLNAPADEFARAFGLDALLGTPAPDAADTGDDAAHVEPPTPDAAASGEPNDPPAAAAAAAADDAADDPEAVEPPKEPAKGAPLTKFSALQGGTEVEVPPDLTFTFTANGKEYKDLPIDRVIRMAQSAGNNETLREQAMQAEAAQMAAEERVAEYERTHQQALADADALIARLLTDDDYLERARDRYARVNSPEARADRAETELARTRDTEQQQHAAAQARSFVTEQLAPAMETLLTRHDTVTQDELWGRFSLMTNHLKVNGVIPPRRIPDVARVFREKIVPWVAETHENRTVTAAQQKAQSDAAVRQAQTNATLAKRQLAKFTRPSSGGAVTIPSATATPAPKEPVIESADDAVAAVVQSVRQSAALSRG